MAKKKKTDNKEEKPKRKMWSIQDVVGVSDKALTKITWIAGIIAFLASANNLFMVASYALAVSMDAPLLATQGVDAGWATAVNWIMTIGQVLVSIMLQLGTDFCLLFAAGLAIHKFKMTPTLAIFLWVICAANTVAMKFDIYHSIRDGRIEEIKLAEKPNIEQQQSINWMLQYADNDEDGQPDKALPRSIDALQSAIDAATETITDKQISIEELQAEKLQTVEDRKDEYTLGGRGPKYNDLTDRIDALTLQITEQRSQIDQKRLDRDAAISEQEERKAYEGHLIIVKGWDERPEITKSDLGYDGEFYVWMRVFGLSILSIVGILVAFAADKANEDRKKEEAEKAKRSAAAQKGVETRRANANIYDTDYEEATVEMEALPDFNADTADKQGNEIIADYATQTPQSPDIHPDKAGDDYGVGIDGTKGSLENADYDEYGADGDLGPDAEASEPDEGEQGPDKDDRSV